MIAYDFPHKFDASRYATAYLRTGISEAQVQLASVARLVARWRAVVTEIDVGDRRFRGRMAAVVAAAGGDPRKVEGRGGQNLAGIVDLAVTFPHLGGRSGWFEVKRPVHLTPSPRTGRLIQAAKPGAPTDEQLKFLERQQRAGAIVGVIWAAPDLDQLVPGAA